MKKLWVVKIASKRHARILPHGRFSDALVPAFRGGSLFRYLNAAAQRGILGGEVTSNHVLMETCWDGHRYTDLVVFY
jgi:hypothetical protein